jgi:DNA polymerase-3 subunit delta'
MEQGNHPDFRLVQPQDAPEPAPADAGEPLPATSGKGKSNFIVIDQIRELGEMIGLSAHRNGLRVALLVPAERLNANAANALLKMLEEPPPATVFILVTHQLQRVLPTIRSRCLKIAMPLPPREQAESWLAAQGVEHPSTVLAFSGGSPLEAVATNDGAAFEGADELFAMLDLGARVDPFQISAHWGRGRQLEVIAMLQKWCYDMLSVKLACKARYLPSRSASLQALCKSVDLGKLLDFQRRLQEARALATHALNAELQLESLLMEYAQLFQGAVKT